MPEELGVHGLGGRILILAAPSGGAEPTPRPEGRGGRGPRREREARGDRDRREGRDNSRRSREPRERAPRREEPARDEGPLELETGDLGVVGGFVERIVRSIATSGRIRIEESELNGETLITVRGPGADALARRQHGLGLALSHLAHRAAQNLESEDASVRVELGERGASSAPDEDDEPRDPRLETLAHEQAERVRESGEPAMLEPMNSRERFIVHNAVKREDGVSSESVGEGREKRVKIFPL